MTLYEKYLKIQKIGCEVETPYDIWRVFGNSNKNISIVANDICLGEDYVSLELARAALEWYTKQLGGDIKWQK